MSFRWGEQEEVLKNRKNFLDVAGIAASDCIAMEVSHGTEVIVVDGAFRGRGLDGTDSVLKADALITATPNLFLFLLTGDCLPVIFFDQKKKFVALAHLSRLNAQELFVQKVVKALEKIGSQREDIFAAFGPGILKDSYIFSEDEIKTRIPDQKNWGDFLIRLHDGRIAIDFLGWNILQLRDVGILEENIETSGIDTGRNENFFSHYRSCKTGEPEGRMATVAGLIK